MSKRKIKPAQPDCAGLLYISDALVVNENLADGVGVSSLDGLGGAGGENAVLPGVAHQVFFVDGVVALFMPPGKVVGKIIGFKWFIRKIENSALFDRYMASGKKDKDCYTEETVVANYNVFECYDSQNCKPKFYDGHFEDDFDYIEAEAPEESIDGYIKYLQENDDELPKNFYLTQTEMKKELEIS